MPSRWIVTGPQHASPCPYRVLRITPTLFPVPQGADRHIGGLGKPRLREPGRLAEILDRVEMKSRAQMTIPVENAPLVFHPTPPGKLSALLPSGAWPIRRLKMDLSVLDPQLAQLVDQVIQMDK